MSIPTAVLPVNIEIIIALAVGFLLYRKKVDALIPSIIALILLYVFVYIGSFTPLSFEAIGMDKASQSTLIPGLPVFSRFGCYSSHGTT